MAVTEPPAVALALALRAGAPDVAVGFEHLDGCDVLTVARSGWEWPYLLPVTSRQARLLAAMSAGRPALVPTEATLRRRRSELAAALGLRMPPSIKASAMDSALLGFCRRHGWQLRLHDASIGGEHLEVDDWTSLTRAIGACKDPGGWLLEPRPHGDRREIHFCALRGALIGTTGFDDDLDGLQGFLRDTGWTGGGCLVLRSEQGFEEPCLDRVLPCFSAHVAALALTGVNLATALLDAAPPPAPRRSTSSTSPARAPRVQTDSAPPIDTYVLDDLDEIEISSKSTPFRHFLTRSAKVAVATACALRDLSTSHVSVQIAYSLKTNPDTRLLGMLLDHGAMAEAISQDELSLALKSGFASGDAVLNSGAKWWPARFTRDPVFACFEESHEELERTVAFDDRWPAARFTGPRVRGFGSQTRLGIVSDRREDVQRTADALRRLPPDCGIGVHFHTAPGLVGYERWWSLTHEVLDAAVALQEATGRPVEVVDLGGGWPFRDFAAELRKHLPAWLRLARARLDQLSHVLFEPGKAVAEPSMALVVRVLHIRGRAQHRDVLVDGSLAELPGAALFPHRVLARNRAGEWAAIGKGTERVVGRLPSDADLLLENVSIPPWLEDGDALVFLDAGAYDASLAYEFGRGTVGGPSLPLATSAGAAASSRII